MNKKAWYFIDIDNCIMPNIHGNDHFYTNEQEKIDDIINAYQRTKNIRIYPEFIEWFKRTTSNPNIDIEELNFTTGRQENCFGWITEKQLEPLQEIHWYQVLYFSSYMKHSWERYKHFKVSIVIQELEYIDFHGIINIYDDINLLKDYQEAIDRPFNFYLITKPEDWNQL